jgi:CHAD domain-containing protein
MPRLPEPVVLTIGDDVEDRHITRWVSGTEASGPGRVVERILLDTFDGRLYRRRLTLWREGPRKAATLRLQEPGAADLTAPLETADPDRLLAADLPDGVLGDRLRSVIDERALVPLVRVRSRVQSLRLCNGDGKTVVRLTVEEPSVVGRGEAAARLDRRLRVDPVLGYDREMERAVTVLRRRLPEPAGSLATEALAAAGLAPGGVQADVDVELHPDMRADQAMSAICRRLADVVDDNRAGTVADTDPEFLHDLRVAIRRSRSVLKEMRGVLPAEQTTRARADLRWIQEITGPTRDLDVLLHEWPSMVSPVPPWMAADLRPLLDLLRRERADAYTAMRKALTSRRFAAAWAAWRGVITESRFNGPDAGRPIGEMAGGRIVAVYRSMTRAGSAIDDDSPPEALHDLRKRGKELRYLLELFGAMWPSERVKPLIGALKGLQDVLGHFQDDEIQVKELRSLGPDVAATPGGTDSLIALGFVIEELSRRQHEARADFARRFADFAAPDNRRIVTGTFQ